jgi:hypothetical protein
MSIVICELHFSKYVRKTRTLYAVRKECGTVKTFSMVRQSAARPAARE